MGGEIVRYFPLCKRESVFQRAIQGTAAHGSSAFLHWASAPPLSADKGLVGSSLGLALKEDKKTIFSPPC